MHAIPRIISAKNRLKAETIRKQTNIAENLIKTKNNVNFRHFRIFTIISAY